MSFSGEIKRMLAAELPSQACCRAAMLYALLECGRGFSERELSFQTEYPEVAALYESLLVTFAGVRPRREERGFIILTVPEEQRETVLHRFGHRAGEVALRLNRGNFDCEHCAAAYVRGVFLACGAVSAPQTDYHLELSVPTYPLSRDIETLLSEWDLPPKRIRRKGDNVLYYKDSESIEDMLTLMGAGTAALELMSVKMVKDIRNNTNRVINCESANIDKVVAAAAGQVGDIRRIERHGGLGQLPSELQELARLRLENPELSLRELGERLEPSLTRSGVNHRLQRIREYAADLPEGEN